MTISWPIFCNSYISAMCKMLIDIQAKSITFDRCSNIITNIQELTICGRYSHILPFKVGTTLILQRFSTYNLLLINCNILAEPSICASSIIRKSHFSALYHNWYIIWEKLMSAVCAEVSNQVHSVIHSKMSELQSLVSNYVYKLRWTED